MPDVAAVIRARREALGLSAAELGARVGSNATQVSRWENGRQEPLASNCRMLAAALGLSADELLGLVSVDLDLSGQWFAAWDTTRGGRPVIDRHEISAKHRGVDMSFAATGDYLWSGSLRFVEGSLQGAYLSSEHDGLYRGALYFWLSGDSEAAIGKWSGKWADGIVGGGWGVLARSEARAGRLMSIVLNHDGPLTEWPREETS